MMVQMVYASEATRPMTKEDLLGILAACKENNPKRLITGVLFYGQGRFIQCLEGPRSEVNELYLQIASDDRHRHCELYLFQDAKQRLFAEWSMGYVSMTKVNKNLFLKYGLGEHLDTSKLSGQQSLEFLKECRDVIGVVSAEVV